jgi:hypothetical protein
MLGLLPADVVSMLREPKRGLHPRYRTISRLAPDDRRPVHRTGMVYRYVSRTEEYRSIRTVPHHPPATRTSK